MKSVDKDWTQIRERLARAGTARGELSAERAQAILEERARALAKAPPQSLRTVQTLELVVFELGGEKYALPADCVREVFRLTDYTAVPGTPDLLVGVTNLRGQILALFDLRRHFGIPKKDQAEAVLVLGDERAELGLLADAVLEVARVRAEQVLPPPDSLSAAVRKFVRGVTEQALILLDGALLLSDPLLLIDEGESSGNGRHGRGA